MNGFQQEAQPAAMLKTGCIVLWMVCCDSLAQDATKSKDVSSPLRQAVARGEKTLRFDVKGEGFELVRIPPGEFLLGSPQTESGRGQSEGPVRPIKITKPFYLGRYEVTQKQFLVVMDGNPNRASDGLPVFALRYYEIFDFNRRLSQLLGVRVALPSEAMWEYACRAGSISRYHRGDTEEDLGKVAWYAANAGGKPHAVGQKEPNAWGLYDMHGNVWELCADILPDYEKIAGADPVGRLIDPKPYTGGWKPLPDSPYMVGDVGVVGCLRGGSFLHGARLCRAAYRVPSPDRWALAGFRICIEPHRLDDVSGRDERKVERHPEGPDEDPFKPIRAPNGAP